MDFQTISNGENVYYNFEISLSFINLVHILDYINFHGKM